MRIIILYVSLAVGFITCMGLETGQGFKDMASGLWKGTFVLEDKIIPLTFEVKNTDKKGEAPIIVFKNGQEVAKAKNVRFWGDSLFIVFEKKELKLKFEVDQMEGFLFDENNEHYPIKFIGQFGIPNRFPDVRKAPIADLTGAWKVTLNVAADSTLTGMLRIVAKENYAEAKILLATGLEMHSEGTVQNNEIFLSGFDGQTACLMHATISERTSLINGNLLLNHDKYTWTAQAIAGVEQEGGIKD